MSQTSLFFHIIGIGILIQAMMELYVYGKRERRRLDGKDN